MNLLEEVKSVAASAERLYAAEDVDDAVKRLALAISERVQGQELVVLCVMNGGLITTALLASYMPNLMRMDYVHASRYRDRTTGDDLQWYARPRSDLRGETVLVVDDIFDEGFTLKAIHDYCCAQGAKSVYSVTLVNKSHRRKVPGFTPDYVGLTVPDRYVFGSGMDYKGYLRNMPGVFALSEQAGNT